MHFEFAKQDFLAALPNAFVTLVTHVIVERVRNVAETMANASLAPSMRSNSEPLAILALKCLAVLVVTSVTR